MVNPKPLFRLFLKAVGVFLLASVIAEFGASIIIVLLVSASIFSEPLHPAYFVYAAMWLSVRLTLGLYLFFGGEWLVNLAFPRTRLCDRGSGSPLTSNEAGE